MQLPLTPQEAEWLLQCLEIGIDETLKAKEHSLSCVSVESTEQLLEINQDYDETIISLSRIFSTLQEVMKQDERNPARRSSRFVSTLRSRLRGNGSTG